MEPKLTLKQKRFCDFYIQSGNATESAIKARYSKKTAQEIGSENLSKPMLKNYIDKRLQKLDEESIMNQKDILKRLSEIAKGTHKGKQIIAYREFHEVVEIEASVSEQISALDKLAKINGMYSERLELSGEIGVKIVDDLSDE